MNPKERYYSGVARETIHRITANRENWTSFLATMARNYDFTYPEQVMIYAQRPNATLCKPYEEWNTDQYRRYVKRGSTGIALFVMNQDKPYLRYVFDVADTGVRRSSPSITPWRVTDENRRFIMDEMERVFQVPSEGILEYQLENIAINLAREYWDDFKKPILDIVADSFLEEYDEYNIEVAFKTAVANSVSYAMYSRITENPDNYFEHEDSGHAQVKMVADVYSHIIDDDRRLNAERMEAAFYSGRQATPEPVQPAATESSADDKELLLKLLQNPEMAALLKSLAKTL